MLPDSLVEGYLAHIMGEKIGAHSSVARATVHLRVLRKAGREIQRKPPNEDRVPLKKSPKPTFSTK